MSGGIRQYLLIKCGTYALHSDNQSCVPFLCTKCLNAPMVKVATDNIKISDQGYLVTMDLYSKFTEDGHVPKSS